MDKDDKRVILEFINQVKGSLLSDEDIDLFMELQSKIDVFEFISAIEEFWETEGAPYTNLRSIEDFKNIDLTAVALSLLKFLKSKNIVDERFYTREELIPFIFKLIRISLNIARKVLAPLDPGLLENLLHSAKVSIAEISYIEGEDPSEMLEALNIDGLLNLTALDKAKLPQLTINAEEKKVPKVYFIWVGPAAALDLLARLLHEEYDLIKQQSRFIKLFNSNGQEVSCANWRKERLEHLACLIYKLYKEKKWIKLSHGKGYWGLAQQSFVDFSGENLSKDLRKVSSMVNNSKDTNNQIIKEIDEILAETERSS